MQAQRAEAQLRAENVEQRARLADERAADERRGPCNPGMHACERCSLRAQFSYLLDRGGAPPRRSGPSRRWASLPLSSSPPPPPFAVPTPPPLHPLPSHRPQLSLPAIICARNHLYPQSSLPAIISDRAIISARSHLHPQSSLPAIICTRNYLRPQSSQPAQSSFSPRNHLCPQSSARNHRHPRYFFVCRLCPAAASASTCSCWRRRRCASCPPPLPIAAAAITTTFPHQLCLCVRYVYVNSSASL